MTPAIRGTVRRGALRPIQPRQGGNAVSWCVIAGGPQWRFRARWVAATVGGTRPASTVPQTA